MYTIKNGTVDGAIEIYFNQKPNEETRSALKEMHFRWNGKKACWYGFKSSEDVINAIGQPDNNEKTATEEPFDEDAFNKEFSVKSSDGYLGAIETTGSKHGYYYGAELSKAIRTDLKKWNIKGVTVSCKTYSGGQSLYLTIVPNDDDFKSFEEYTELFKDDTGNFDFCKLHDITYHGELTYSDGVNQYGYKTYKDIDIYALQDFEKTEKEKIIFSALRRTYELETSGNLNKYHMDSCKAYTEQFLARFNRIKQVVDSYNHDDSNSMVDYFDRSFYEDYIIKTA